MSEHLNILFSWFLRAVGIPTLIRREIMIKMLLMNSDRSNMANRKIFTTCIFWCCSCSGIHQAFHSQKFIFWLMQLPWEGPGIAVWTQNSNSCSVQVCSRLWQSQHLGQVFTMAMYYCSKNLLCLGQKRQGEKKSPKNSFSIFMYK